MNHYDICLQTMLGRNIQPQQKRRLLPHLPIYSELLALADQRDKARQEGNEALAASLKEEAQQIFDAWFDEQDLRLSLEADEMEQVAAARESVGRTEIERVQGIPF